MPIITISRDLIQTAIEAGLSAAPTLTDDEREALRNVGRTATRLGTNYSDECGCPASAAGLVRGEEIANIAIFAFVYAYDEVLWHKNGPIPEFKRAFGCFPDMIEVI